MSETDPFKGGNGNGNGTPPPGARKRDPWEERERMRARYSSASQKTAGRAPSKEGVADSGEDGLNLRENYLPFGLIISLILLLLSEIPRIPADLRTFLAQGGTTCILLLLGTCRGFLDSMPVALRRGANPLILALVLWSGASLFWAPFRTQAAAEMLRVLAGAGTYFLAAYTLRTHRQITYVIAGLLSVGCLLSLYDFSQTGQVGGGLRQTVSLDYSLFGTHENVGSLLVLLLPAALAFAIHGGIREKQRLAALAATVILGGALLVARTRSAWIGGVFALFALAYLLIRFGGEDLTASPDEGSGTSRGRKKSPRTRLSRLIGSPIVVIAIGFAVFVTVGGLAPFLSSRAGLIMGAMEDSAFTDRLIMWDGAARMASEKPLTGWGLGAFLVQQGHWTHKGVEIAQALKTGAGHENIAHNYYAQWAADTGGIGLFLYVSVLVAFLLSLLQNLKAKSASLTAFQKALACASGAAIVGASVDAIASPAYNFHGVSSIFWAWMGLGVAALRPVRAFTASEASPALRATTWNVWVGALGTGVLAAILVVGWGFRQRATGQAKPRGVFQVVADPAGPARPGTTVNWRAVFKDESGKEVSTMPGTRWDIAAERAILSKREAASLGEVQLLRDGPRYSVFRLLVPATRQPLSVKATYKDRYGRTYEAWSTKTVAPPPSSP